MHTVILPCARTMAAKRKGNLAKINPVPRWLRNSKGAASLEEFEVRRRLKQVKKDRCRRVYLIKLRTMTSISFTLILYVIKYEKRIFARGCQWKNYWALRYCILTICRIYYDIVIGQLHWDPLDFSLEWCEKTWWYLKPFYFIGDFSNASERWNVPRARSAFISSFVLLFSSFSKPMAWRYAYGPYDKEEYLTGLDVSLRHRIGAPWPWVKGLTADTHSKDSFRWSPTPPSPQLSGMNDCL